MKKLDDNTLESIAELICGADGGGNSYHTSGPYRSMSRILDFFARARVQPQGESGTRKWFVKESLQAIDGTGELESVILRLAWPHEYRDPEMRRDVLTHLNQLLQLEGLEVWLSDARPQLRKIAPSVPGLESEKEPSAPLPDFSRIVGSGPLADILTFRWEEAERCVRAEAYLSAVVMMGSILEGVLLFKMEQEPAAANRAKTAPKDGERKAKPFRKWGLSALIDVAHEMGWLQVDVKRFSHALRESRNIVHPYVQRAVGGKPPDRNTCMICREVVKAAIDNLAK